MKRIFFFICLLAFVSVDGASIRLGRCQEPAVTTPAQSPPKISHIKAFIFNYGVNNADFWGFEDASLIAEIHQKTVAHVVESPTVVMLADAGLPFGGDYRMYFVESGRLKPQLAVSFPGPIGLIISFQGTYGQADASGIRFFNGVFRGHCQTFAASAETKTNEQTGSSVTTINLFYFDPGLVFKDGGSELPPSFLLLNQYVSSNNNSDPDIVLSQEFSLPLPHSYYDQTGPDYPYPIEYTSDLSKELSLPKESKSNSYYPNQANTGC